jgi:hypothetical protein
LLRMEGVNLRRAWRRAIRFCRFPDGTGLQRSRAGIQLEPWTGG